MKFFGRIAGADKLQKSLKKLPEKQMARIEKAIVKSCQEGAAMARTLAPKGRGKPDPELGRLVDGIHYKIEHRDHLIIGSVEAAPPTKEAQIKARAVEFGRKQGRVGLGTRLKGTPSQTGTTKPHPFITRAQELLAEKHKRRIRSAISRSAKEALNG